MSRLNRAYEDKKDVVVVDFTNNAKAILEAFVKYRKGTPFEPEEPDKGTVRKALRGHSERGCIHAG
jgi:type I restriction enzyme R subunit